MEKEQKNKKLTRVRIVAITMSFLFFVFSCSSAKADYWGGAMMASRWETMYNNMMKQIENALIASLKEAALQTINQTVNNAISQGANGPMFITNWEDFLINEPQRKADLYMNDFFTSITSGRGSYSYSSAKKLFSERNGLPSEGKVAGAETTAGEGVVAGNFNWKYTSAENYQYALVEDVKGKVMNPSKPICDETDASGMFKGGYWNTYIGIMGNDGCSKYWLENEAEIAKSSVEEKGQKVASAIGQAGQGFLPKMSGNTIITPGSTIAAIQAQTEDLGNKILASAKSAPEVIASIVTRLATKTIQQGIGQAQNYAQREINNQVNGATQQIRNQTDPRQIFKPSY